MLERVESVESVEIEIGGFRIGLLVALAAMARTGRSPSYPRNQESALIAVWKKMLGGR